MRRPACPRPPETPGDGRVDGGDGRRSGRERLDPAPAPAAGVLPIAVALLRLRACLKATPPPTGRPRCAATARWRIGCRLTPAWTITTLGPPGGSIGPDRPLRTTVSVSSLTCEKRRRTVNADTLAAAVAAVPRKHYTDHPVHGSPPQTTTQAAIERDILRAAGEGDLTGRRILEIGTGTGYTGALLAELAGPGGTVTSVDIDARLVDRARRLHAERNRPVRVVCGDGHDGVLDAAPFDVVIGWCAPTIVPGAWIKQIRPGGIISTPVYIAPVARAVGHLRAIVTEHATLTALQLGDASYVDMGHEVNTMLGTPLFYADARVGESYLSVAWRGRDDTPDAALALLNAPAHLEDHPLGEEDPRRAAAWRDARTYLTARGHALGVSSLTTWGSGAPDWEVGVGFSCGRHAAVLTDSGQLRADRKNSPALAELRDALTAWEDAGRPGPEQLALIASPCEEGWQVRATLP
ncbi:protein-L-isoaspartate O-methyltransferase family protein [Streptosporangium sandarakinum]|uniref:protein-L-isoaspartate O-methyltransferase family protein n=1 Tax=Streptosporangium sandarakinum TaxID=1260955 RepID=UPI00342967E8